MEWLEKKETVAVIFKKYRWAMLVLLAGLLLMALPEGTKAEAVNTVPEEAAQEETLQQELESILSRLEGAGKVQVLLSIESGPQTHYQLDTNQTSTDTSSDKRTETVIITGTDRNQSGLVQRVDPPVYLGAVVLCQGADSPQVKLAIVDAVGTATGLTSDKISVWKMK